jgi:hypothetical protein
MAVKVWIDPSEVARFWAKVEKTDYCWNWTAGCNGRNKEYGCFYPKGSRKPIGAHVWSYEAIHGKVPDGLVVDHLCNNTKCVRPDHLEPKTHRENILRGTAPPAVDAHILSNGARDCRVCRQIRNRRRTAKYRSIHG